MVEHEVAAFQSHRNNIKRYHRLLETHLTDLERQYVESRLLEEQAALRCCAIAHGELRGPAAASAALVVNQGD